MYVEVTATAEGVTAAAGVGCILAAIEVVELEVDEVELVEVVDVVVVEEIGVDATRALNTRTEPIILNILLLSFELKDNTEKQLKKEGKKDHGGFKLSIIFFPSVDYFFFLYLISKL